MMGGPDVEAPEETELQGIAPMLEALSLDLELLAILHDREPSATLIEALRLAPIGDQLALRMTSADGEAALSAFGTAVSRLPVIVDQPALDELAAGYADVYWRHGYRAAPTESFWLTEDGLERQQPMLDIRADLKRDGLRLADWASRPEDHLVPQLRYLGLRFSRAGRRVDVEAAVRHMDAHLLRWIRQFASRLVAGDAPEFYAALAVLTSAWLDEARGVLGAVTGIERAVARDNVHVAGPISARSRPRDAEDGPYVPGVAPSW